MKHTQHDKFLSKASEVHGAKYTFERTEYVNASTPLLVTCQLHGDFTATPKHFLRGRGCPKCRGAAISTGKQKGFSWFVTECNVTHAGKYIYVANSYVDTRHNVTVVCPEHGEFSQNAWAHKQGQGCPACGTARSAAASRYTTHEFASAASVVHNNKYEYHDEFSGAKGKQRITCPTHGDFFQEGTSHLQGRGCPSCAKATLSQVEWDIISFVKAHGFTSKHGYRPDWMQGKELDIFVPELNLAIEYCGSWVHNSTKHPFGAEPKKEWYHYDKWKLCRDNGVTLLTIYDFEWFASREKWEAVIRHKLQKADRRVYARKCQIVSVERAVAYQFCKDHHIESAGGAWTYQAVCLGLVHQGELIAVMVEDKGDIKRSCTLSGAAVIGGVSRLFKAFPAGTTMMTTNNTGSSGNYGTLLAKKTTRYWWVKLGSVPLAIPRRQCQKHLLEKRFGIPVGEKTERQYMEDLGYVRCYDSGLSYWVNT